MTDSKEAMPDFRRDLEYIAENANIEVVGQIRFKLRYQPEWEKIPINELELGARAKKICFDNRIATFADIMKNWGNFMNYSNCGITTVKQIKNALLAYYYERLNADQRSEFWRDALAEFETKTEPQEGKKQSGQT